MCAPAVRPAGIPLELTVLLLADIDMRVLSRCVHYNSVDEKVVSKQMRLIIASLGNLPPLPLMAINAQAPQC